VTMDANKLMKNCVPVKLKYKNIGDGLYYCFICCTKSGLNPYNTSAIANIITVSNVPPNNSLV